MMLIACSFGNKSAVACVAARLILNEYAHCCEKHIPKKQLFLGIFRCHWVANEEKCDKHFDEGCERSSGAKGVCQALWLWLFIHKMNYGAFYSLGVGIGKKCTIMEAILCSIAYPSGHSQCFGMPLCAGGGFYANPQKVVVFYRLFFRFIASDGICQWLVSGFLNRFG
jgi:hypothetical protein